MEPIDRDGTISLRRKPRELAERYVRLMRERISGDQTDGLGDLQSLLSEFKDVGDSLRSACEELAADQHVDREDRFFAAWLAFRTFGSTSPAMDSIFLQCLVREDTHLWSLFFLTFSASDKLPPVTLDRLESFLNSDDRFASFCAASVLKRKESIVVLGRHIRESEPDMKMLAAAALCRMEAVPDRPKRLAAEVVGLLLDDPATDWELRSSIAFHLGQMGKHAEPTLPKLAASLKNPLAPGSYKYAAVQAIREMGRLGAGKTQTAEALSQAIDSGDARTVLIAAEGFAALRAKGRKMLRALIRLLDHEDGGVRGAAAEHIGQFKEKAEEAVQPLIALWLRDDDSNVLKSTAASLARIGRPAVDPMFALLATGNLKKIPLPMEVLLSMPDVPFEEILHRMIECTDHEITESIAVMMRIAGPRMKSVMPVLRFMLSSGSPRQQLIAAIALSGARHEALPAAPELAEILAKSDDPVLLQWASEVLGWIGEAAYEVIEPALARASGLGRTHLLELRERIKPVSIQCPIRTGVDLSWCKKTKHLRMFRLIGEYLRSHGPSSYDDISKFINLRVTRGELDDDFKSTRRNIGLVLESLEEAIGQHTGRVIRLTDRSRTTKGGLTPEGDKLLDDIVLHFNDID